MGLACKNPNHLVTKWNCLDDGSYYRLFKYKGEAIVMGYVFISYSSKNQEESNAVKNYLSNHGVYTWMAPGDIPAGSQYAEVISQALKNCSCMILLLTDQSQNSIWVSKEVERAIHYNKTIIPLQLGDVIMNDSFEFFLASTQVIAVKRIDESEAMNKLLASVKVSMGTENMDESNVSTTSDEIMKDIDLFGVFMKKLLNVTGHSKDEIDRYTALAYDAEDEICESVLNSLSVDELRELDAFIKEDVSYEEIDHWFEIHVPNIMDMIIKVIGPKLSSDPEMEQNDARPYRNSFINLGKNDTSGNATAKSAAHNMFIGVGRNDMCPCGSGKKYKFCCGAKE